MERKRTIKCDCGGKFQTQEKEFNGLRSEALVCSKCGYTTLTREQAEELLHLKKLEDLLSKERRVIKIGNSIGITLPEGIGVRQGQSVKIKPLDEHSFELSIR